MGASGRVAASSGARGEARRGGYPRDAARVPACPRVARALAIPLLACAVVAAALAGLAVGATPVGVRDVVAALTGGDVANATRNIVLNVRLPRVLAALLAGTALATSGAIIQTALDNPLASPNIIGINSGAGLAVLLCSSLLPGVAPAVPVAAFAGAVLTALLVLALATRGGSSRLTLVLVGIAVSTVFGAGMNTVLIVNPDAYVGASTFLVGGLSSVRMGDLAWPAVYVAAGMALALAGTRALNVMAMGEALAGGVGMNVRRCRLALMLVAALLAAGAVSFAGLVGFVGLVVPHMVRFATGSDARLALPASALAGAAFLCACDVAARTLFAPYELPVGILMAFVGGPFFVWLIWRNGRGGRDA